MSKFIKETLDMNDKINIVPEPKQGKLYAAFIPYFIDPESMELKIVLERKVMPGSYAYTGIKMGLTALKIELPLDEQLTIEEVFEKLDLNAKIENPIALGGIMSEPERDTNAYEMVLVQIAPITEDQLDSNKGLISFDDILTAIKENIIQDAITRMVISELYILAMEEAAQNQNPNELNAGDGLVGNKVESYDLNISEEVKESNIPRTSDISEEVLEMNKQKDFGKIYSKK